MAPWDDGFIVWGATSRGRSTRKISPRLMLRSAKSPTHISGLVDLTWYRDRSWVTWCTEHFCCCGTIDDPLALGLVVRNGLGYGGDTSPVLTEFSNTRIKFLADESISGFVEVIIAGKGYMRR